MNSLRKAKAFVLCIPLRVGEWAGSVPNAPAPFLGHRLSVANQRSRPWRRKPEAESGGRPGPREAGRGRRSCGPWRSWAGGSGGRCGGGAKTAGMVGRENELSIHFVPGSCRLVEVRESAWGSRRNRECRGERASGFDLPCAFCRNPSPRLWVALAPPSQLWEERAAPPSLFTPVLTRQCLLFQSCGRKRVGLVSLWFFCLPSQERRRAFQSSFGFVLSLNFFHSLFVSLNLTSSYLRRRKCFFRNSRFGDDNLLNSYLSARHYVMHFTCIINRHNCEILFLLHFADEKIEVYMMSSSSKLIQ